MANQLQEIQEDLMEYFKDIDDKTFIAIVDVIVYQLGTTDSNISKLSEKFLKDTGLEEAYLNYILELNNPSKFLKANPTDVRMIENVNVSLISIGFIRFKRTLRNSKVVSKPNTYSTPLVTKLTRDEKNELKTIIGYCSEENENLIEGETITRSMFEKDEADELMARRYRLRKLFTKVLTILK